MDTDPLDGSDPMNKEWWTIETFSRYLSVSRPEFYRMRHLGDLPPRVMTVGKRLYWKREDAIKWAQDRYHSELMAKEWWDAKDLILFLKVDVVEFNRMLQAGTVPPMKWDGGRSIVWNRNGVLKWAEKNWPNKDKPDKPDQ